MHRCGRWGSERQVGEIQIRESSKFCLSTCRHRCAAAKDLGLCLSPGGSRVPAGGAFPDS